MASFYVHDTLDEEAFKAALDFGQLTEYKYRRPNRANRPYAQKEFDQRRDEGRPAVLWRIDTMSSRAVRVVWCNIPD